jgi:hypothetical protein
MGQSVPLRPDWALRFLKVKRQRERVRLTGVLCFVPSHLHFVGRASDSKVASQANGIDLVVRRIAVGKGLFSWLHINTSSLPKLSNDSYRRAMPFGGTKTCVVETQRPNRGEGVMFTSTRRNGA